jgi:hypothetical protein
MTIPIFVRSEQIDDPQYIISELFDSKYSRRFPWDDENMKCKLYTTDSKWWQVSATNNIVPSCVLTELCIFFKHNFNFSPTYSCVCSIERWFYFEIGEYLNYGDKSGLEISRRTDISLLRVFPKEWFSCNWKVSIHIQNRIDFFVDLFIIYHYPLCIDDFVSRKINKNDFGVMPYIILPSLHTMYMTISRKNHKNKTRHKYIRMR